MLLVVVVLVHNGVIFHCSCFLLFMVFGLCGVHFFRSRGRAFETLSLLMLVMGISVAVLVLVLLFLCVDFEDKGGITCSLYY